MEFRAPKQEKPKSGLAFNLFVRVFGLAGFAAFMLPYYKGIPSVEIGQLLLDTFQSQGFAAIPEALFANANETAQGMTLAWMLVAGPILGVFFSLWMVLSGKYAGGPFTFALCFVFLGWVAFTIFKSHLGIEMGFFSFVDTGFWAQMGALSIPLLGMFALDKSI